MKLARARLPDWLWAAGATTTVLAARLHEIHRHTGVVPYNDQWKIEAADLIAPWLDGTLSVGTFFAPHFEHVPVWTRLSAWAQVALTGRWDPLVQTTINAALFAGFTGLLVRWFVAALPRLAALLLTLLTIALGALPHSWENIAWGFQSQFPFALLFLFFHTHGTFSHPAGSRRWWFAQLAGIAGLFTLASMWLAPCAVVLAGWWSGARRSARDLVPLFPAIVGAALVALIRLRAPDAGAFALQSQSPWQFLAALLDLLGWPSGRPGAIAVLTLPLALFALQLRGRRDACAFDLIVLALGVWSAGQAVALAYARGADYDGYVSRYGELLAVFTLASALALARLASLRLVPRAMVAGGVLLWTGVVGAGLHDLTYGGHTAYFHEHSAPHNVRRLEAVRRYLTHHDASLLHASETRSILYPDSAMIARLLDQPRFRAVLPSALEPSNAPDLAGRAVRTVQRHALLATLFGGLVFFVGCAVAGPNASAELPALTWRREVLLPPLAGVTALIAAVLVFGWEDPLEFSAEARWKKLLQPADSIGLLAWHFETASTALPASRLAGAAPLLRSAEIRNFTGTAADGGEFRCTAVSERFPLSAPELIVPLAGFPTSVGNGVRLRIEDANGVIVTELAYTGPNPVHVGIWSINLKPYTGRFGRLVLLDGRADTENWLAVTPPIRAASSNTANDFRRHLARERIAPAHTSLALLACVGTLVAALGALGLAQSVGTRVFSDLQ